MSDKLLINNDYLIRLAGKPAFNRGMDYFKGGHVLELKQKGSKITAEVEGSEIYLVTLKWTSSQLDGACDCPASDGFDFCKHCVAVALTLQEAQAEQNKLAQGGTENRIKAFLLKQDKQKLADWLLELIETDRTLLQQWSMRADRDLGVLDVKALKKRITAAIPYNRHLYRYKQVRNYFAQVEIVMDQLCEMAEQLSAEDTLKQGANYDEKWPYFQIQHMLEQQATLSNDSHAIIRLKQKTATDLYDYQDLAERCLEIGDYEAVETWLEKCRLASERNYHLRTERIQIRTPSLRSFTIVTAGIHALRPSGRTLCVQNLS